MSMNTLRIKSIALSGMMMSLIFISCQSTEKEGTSKASTTINNTTAEAQLPIAYVRMDSVLSQYTYSKEIQTKLEADVKASQSRLQGKAAAFQKAAEDFQRRAQVNAFTSEAQAKSEQERVMKLQQEAAQLDQQLSGELAQRQALMQEDLMKKIREEIKLFNGGRYKLILTEAVILDADNSFDITEAFIKHLNDNYKPAAESTQQAK